MAKNKFGKLLILGALAGAAAAGVYHYLQSKDRELDEVLDGITAGHTELGCIAGGNLHV